MRKGERYLLVAIAGFPGQRAVEVRELYAGGLVGVVELPSGTSMKVPVGRLRTPCWVCPDCKKRTQVNTAHALFHRWVLEGLRTFCSKCMKNTQHTMEG